MNLLISVMFLGVATAVNVVNFCPEVQEVDWEIELLLPHRYCNKFYQCTHGQPTEMSCPKGLYFSIINRVCDWREYVECGDRIILEESNPDDGEGEVEAVTPPESDSDENDDQPDEIVQTEKPDFPIVEFLPNGCPVDPEIHWLLPHETDCSLFYYCVQSERDLRRCPFWLHFNRKLKVCDWPRNAGCMLRNLDDHDTN